MVEAMARTFRVSLYTSRDIAEPAVSEALWRRLDNPIVQPRGFDSVERALREFTPSGHEAASDLYADEGMLFVRGGKDGFLAMFMATAGALSLRNIWWDVKAMTGPKGDSWLGWLYELCRELPPLCGSGCSVEEYDAKHVVVEADDLGAVTRTVGASMADFHDFLPGLYWLTIFGPDLVHHFGSRLESLPGAGTVRLTPSQVAVVLDGPVIPDDLDERLRAERALADRLGAKYFFDRTRAEDEYESVPELAATLRRAGAQEEDGP
jgi:hypothetical protein